MEIIYCDKKEIACIDGYSFRRDKSSGYFLSSKKIGGSRKRLHVYVWEKANGRVPKGFHVHHIDEDKYNNELSNLMLIEKHEHEKLHMENASSDFWKKNEKHFREVVIPSAAEWHHSEEGRKWHSDHAKRQWENKEPIGYICHHCGNKFESFRSYPEGKGCFCSNKCKAAARRASGVDDIVKICEECGNEFRANKYQRKRFCSPSCGKEHSRNRRRASLQHDS